MQHLLPGIGHVLKTEGGFAMGLHQRSAETVFAGQNGVAELLAGRAQIRRRDLETLRLAAPENSERAAAIEPGTGRCNLLAGRQCGQLHHP